LYTSSQIKEKTEDVAIRHQFSSVSDRNVLHMPQPEALLKLAAEIAPSCAQADYADFFSCV
jgi:hypothetical protein